MMSDKDRPEDSREKTKPIEEPAVLEKQIDRRNRLNDFDVFAPSRHDFNL